MRSCRNSNFVYFSSNTIANSAKPLLLTSCNICVLVNIRYWLAIQAEWSIFVWSKNRNFFLSATEKNNFKNWRKWSRTLIDVKTNKFFRYLHNYLFCSVKELRKKTEKNTKKNINEIQSLKVRSWNVARYFSFLYIWAPHLIKIIKHRTYKSLWTFW